MTEPTMFTAQQAADPGTPAQMLADIAALRVDLRPIVAANPSAYPGLLEWLGSLGEPAVDAALAGRAGAIAPVTSAGWTPAGSVPVVPHQPAEPWQGQQAQPWQGQQAQQAQPWQGQQAQPWQGQPAQQPQPWQGQQPQPWQGQPAQPYAYSPLGAAPAKTGNKALIIVVVVLGVLLLLGVGAVFAVRALVGNAVETLNSSTDSTLSSGQSFGDDPVLDGLWNACAAEDWAACDELYVQAGLGTAYEDFGSSCGGRVVDAAGTCAELNGAGAGAAVDGAKAYGDDPALDSLWDACAAGDMVACDDLWYASGPGTDYADFADTCGNTRAAGSGFDCTER